MRPRFPRTLREIALLIGTEGATREDELEDRADREAVDHLARNMHSHVRPRLFNTGELVLIKIGKDIREGHKLRAKAPGLGTC